MRCYCGCDKPLQQCLMPEGISAGICLCCGYMKTLGETAGDRIQVQEQHPGAFQGDDGKRFGSFIGGVRAICARYRVRRAQLGEPGKGQVLDFGCGQGYFLDALGACGYRSVGVEISELTSRVAASKGHQVARSVDQLPGASISALVSVHVLEHLPSPEAMLAEVRRVLVPNARVYLEVPNFRSWQARVYGARWLHCEPGLHVHHFSQAAFAEMLASQGILIESWQTYSFEHGLLGWVQSLYNLLFPYNRFFRFVVLNRPLRDKVRSWPEMLLFPLVFPVGLALFLLESMAGKGAVLRIRGRFAAKSHP